jgi:hypothetical protein
MSCSLRGRHQLPVQQVLHRCRDMGLQASPKSSCRSAQHWPPWAPKGPAGHEPAPIAEVVSWWPPGNGLNPSFNYGKLARQQVLQGAWQRPDYRPSASHGDTEGRPTTAFLGVLWATLWPGTGLRTKADPRAVGWASCRRFDQPRLPAKTQRKQRRRVIRVDPTRNRRRLSFDSQL